MLKIRIGIMRGENAPQYLSRVVAAGIKQIDCIVSAPGRGSRLTQDGDDTEP